MRLAAFNIQNFRSIVDSGWVPFSPDGITVLVGQNESGKTSVLEALHCALSSQGPTGDDFRIGASLPTVGLRVEVGMKELDQEAEDIPAIARRAVELYLAEKKNVVEIEVSWTRTLVDGKLVQAADYAMVDDSFATLFAKVQAEEANSAVSHPPSSPQADPTSDTVPVETPRADVETPADDFDPDYLAVVISSVLPMAVLFNEETGRLPNTVDIDDKGQPTGPGARAAINYLKIADINLPALLKGDRRAKENLLNKANSRVSQDFNAFWSQTIGKSGRLLLKCDVSNYSAAAAEKAGKPHLVFWISDGNTQLYPKQRSQGVRWFVSFYLQLKASEKSQEKRVFLLDEPGSNLHARAQADVIKLINRLAKDISTVVYSTHSPQMVEYQKLFRVHAVQRNGDLDDSPTMIIDAHHLGTASTDTLSPILTAMGADLSSHQVIRKRNNVILEEMSGFYYLTAFWKLTATTVEAYFIAATGVNKVETLANMFRGWGLDFIVAIDDDKQGREVFKKLKEELFGDDEAGAKAKLVKFVGCSSIEDVFSAEDFKSLVLKDPKASIPGTNADFLKTAGRSKPVLAFQFWLAVDGGHMAWEALSSESQLRIQSIVDSIASRLLPQA